MTLLAPQLRSPLAMAAARALDALERGRAPGQAVDPATLRRRTLATLTALGASLLVGWFGSRGASLPREIVSEPDVSVALTHALADRSLLVDPTEIFWLDDAPAGLKSRTEKPRALLRARKVGEPADVYLVETRWSPDGRLLHIGGVYNLTDTSAVDEQELTVSGERASWILGAGGKVFSVEYADLRGVSLPEAWGRLAVWQQKITHLQETGSTRGVSRKSYKLDPAPARVKLGLTDDALMLQFDQHSVRIPTETAGEIEGQRFVIPREHAIARPGNPITWAVDRVRAIPAFGNDRMQWVKAIAFAGLDRVERWMGDVSGDDGADEIAENLGELISNRPTEFTDPETGWPPAPMKPMLLHVPIAGEGKWVSLAGDPFVRSNPRAPSPFVFSFIRTDRERVYSQIYVLMWDPRQVELHAVSGTVEPKSATGETGSGLVPRDPRVMKRVVGAFNGGFQAQHGAFGMMADGVVYLPPKPYAATIAALSDGSTGFGTWPADTASIPADLVSFRQNMTPLVAAGELNPYRRHWWGGTPQGWSDDARTVRSGLCMTSEGFVAYFYGSAVDPTHLGMAMQRARCSYGVHLDMNPGHVGLEFFRAALSGSLPNPGRPLDETWEATGSVSGMAGYDFLSRRMIKNMALMNFPRYVQREQRDFFYLTLRDLVAGRDAPTAVEPREAEEGHWRVDGLPQFGWPYALATTSVRPDRDRPETSIRLLQIDPKAVHVAGDSASDAKAPAILTLGAPPEPVPGGVALWHTAGHFSVGQSAAGGDRAGTGQSAAGGDRTRTGQSAAGGDRAGTGQSAAGGDRAGTGQSAAGGDRAGTGQSAAGGDRAGTGQSAAGGDRAGTGQSAAGGDRAGTGQSGAGDADRLAQGYAPSDPRGANAVAAVGVTDGGVAVYAEVASAPRHGADAALLTTLLKQLDCESLVLLDQPLPVAIAGERDLAGHSVGKSLGSASDTGRPGRGVLRIVRAHVGSRGIFSETPVVMPSIWAPLQARRAAYAEPTRQLDRPLK